ncbi:MAG: hypothetical protein IIB05_05280 [Bacteroidetes bacterium]|nr:hypothetical protein [Bacteroidota bacterium]
MEILDILKYTLPALIVFFTSYFLIKAFIQNDQEKRKHEIILQNQKTITPIRLQAYERVTLFLERVSLESLIMRTSKQGMTSKQIQTSMLNTIRAEFEHNLSQQVYMTSAAWELIKNAKSNTIKIINSSADHVKPGAPAIEFSRYILEKVIEMDKEPTKVALEYLKKEVSMFF